MKLFFLTRVLPALVLLVAVGEAVMAQAPADGGPAPTGPTAIPLDGGISLLVAGGVAYGIKQLRNRRKRA
ncbi:PID-CTERM protein-sorting domain-containing protein [Hymenobacter agri]